MNTTEYQYDEWDDPLHRMNFTWWEEFQWEFFRLFAWDYAVVMALVVLANLLTVKN